MIAANTPTTTSAMPTWKACVAFLLTIAVVALAGCNTTAGFGRDVKNSGAYIEDKAEQAK